MSDERLSRIETKVDSLEEAVERLAERVTTQGDDLRREMRLLHEDAIGKIATQGDDLRREMRLLHEDAIGKIATQGDGVRQEMRLLHEDVIGRIADLAPDFAPIRREFKQADDELRESIERRLVPLEAAARSRRRSK
jgi:hypothetical protein